MRLFPESAAAAHSAMTTQNDGQDIHVMGLWRVRIIEEAKRSPQNQKHGMGWNGLGIAAPMGTGGGRAKCHRIRHRRQHTIGE